MEKTNVAIVGLGTVGSGVARLLLDHGDRTARHAGRTMWLKKAVVRDLTRSRDVELPNGVLTDSLQEVIDDDEITVLRLNKTHLALLDQAIKELPYKLAVPFIAEINRQINLQRGELTQKQPTKLTTLQ